MHIMFITRDSGNTMKTKILIAQPLQILRRQFRVQILCYNIVIFDVIMLQ